MVETPRLIVESVTVSNADSVLVSDLSLSIGGGDVLAITGPSGTGKSSLIHVLSGLAAPSSGRVLHDGRPVAPHGDASLGLILQHHHLPAILSAREVVSLPLQARGVSRSEVAERSDGMLLALGLGEHAHQLIAELSGGQRQRVAVARALAGDPELILADEPVAGLDQELPERRRQSSARCRARRRDRGHRHQRPRTGRQLHSRGHARQRVITEELATG